MKIVCYTFFWKLVCSHNLSGITFGVCCAGYLVFFSPYGYLIISCSGKPYLKSTALWCLLCHLSLVSGDMSLFLGSLLLSMNLWLFVSLSDSLYCCSFTINFDIWYQISQFYFIHYDLIIYLFMLLAILDHLHFHIYFRTFLLIYTQNSTRIFTGFAVNFKSVWERTFL